MSRRTLRDLLPLSKFLRLLKVRSKDGPVVSLVPQPEQVDILELLETGDSTLILKPRQIGSSTIIAAYLCWLWLTSPDPITIVVLSFKQKSAKHLLRMIKGFYSSLPEALRFELSTDTKDHVVLEASGAELMAVGAQDDEAARSFTANVIWLSEFAFLPNAEDLLAAAAGSLTTSGQLISESTSNHWDDALHQEIIKVERGESNYRFKFFPWSSHPHYRVEGDTVEPSPEELAWMEQYGLDLEQLAWWRRKVRALGASKARREFPLSVEEAYSQGSGQFFVDGDLDRLSVMDGLATGTKRFEPHNPLHAYSAGFDPSAGVGLDASSFTVYNRSTGRVAATWVSKNHTVEEALDTFSALCVEYHAVLCIEYNNHGHTYVELIREFGAGKGVRLWLDEGKPWSSNAVSKAKLWTDLKKAVQTGVVTAVDTITLSDLRKIKLDKHEKIVLPRTSVGHCDSAVSFALAVMAAGQARPERKGHLASVLDKVKANRLRASSRAHRRY